MSLSIVEISPSLTVTRFPSTVSAPSSVEISPSTYVIVAFVANELVTVVLKLASSPSAAASSFSVSNVAGAASTVFATAVAATVSAYAFASTSAWSAYA